MGVDGWGGSSRDKDLVGVNSNIWLVDDYRRIYRILDGFKKIRGFVDYVWLIWLGGGIQPNRQWLNAVLYG